MLVFSRKRISLIISCVFVAVFAFMLTKENSAENALNDEYTPLNFYQKIILDNALCEYSNFITIVEGFEKDNARNSQ